METVLADMTKIEIKVRSDWTRATPERRQGLRQCGYKPRSDQDGPTAGNQDKARKEGSPGVSEGAQPC